MDSKKSSNRFLTLDYLRGFFIVVIIIDHLSRWPSLFSAITGKAQLWVTAAEGFVIISGLLVGYVRGFKEKNLPLQKVSLSLVRRGLMLWLWAIIGSVFYTAAIWYLPLQGGAPGVPYRPSDWLPLIWESVTLQYTQLWVYFLALYAIYLIVSPLAMMALRRDKAWLVIAASLLVYGIGLALESKLLQWQILFFIPVVAGYYLDTIMRWWWRLDAGIRTRMATGIVAATIFSIGLATLSTFWPDVLSAGAAFFLNELIFPKEPLLLPRVLLAFAWFIGFVLLLSRFINPVKRSVGWLLKPIGTASLTAYIVHGAVLLSLSMIVPVSESIWVNTFLGILSLVGVWAVLKIPRIHRAIPR